MKNSYFVLLTLIFLAGLAHSIVVVNSQDASDVASAVFYANLANEESYVLLPGHDMMASVMFVPTNSPATLVESSANPVFQGVESVLQSRGNTISKVSPSGTSINLELARRSGVKKFIITDPVYGYNIVSTVAYAKATHAYLIFANKTSIGDVLSFLRQSGAESILIYGQVDDEVKQGIAELGITTEEINNGDRYDDNIELFEKYLQLKPTDSILLADGSFLQAGINSGNFPILLVSQLIPDRTYNYVLEKVSAGKLRTATLIGGENIDPVYDMMKRVNSNFPEKRFSVFVMFGQATSAGGETGPLMTFPLPFPSAAVSLDSASYNPASGAFELVYRNNGNAAAFVRSNIVILLNGQVIGTVGDTDNYVIKRGESKGVRYAFANPGEGQLAINDTTYYGISKYSADKGFMKYMDVGRISFVDQSSLVLSDASYSPLEDKLTVKVRNNGSTDASYRLTVAYVNEEGLTVYEEEQARNISSGRNDIVALTGVIKLPQDKADKSTMNATATYGAREAFMEKEASAPVKIEEFPWWILLILLLIILIIAYLYYRKKKKEKEPLEAEAPKKKK